LKITDQLRIYVLLQRLPRKWYLSEWWSYITWMASIKLATNMGLKRTTARLHSPPNYYHKNQGHLTMKTMS
jgi:hypothetical protein